MACFSMVLNVTLAYKIYQFYRLEKSFTGGNLTQRKVFHMKSLVKKVPEVNTVHDV